MDIQQKLRSVGRILMNMQKLWNLITSSGANPAGEIKKEQSWYKTHAEVHGESINGFVNRAIDETIVRDEAGK